MFWGAVVLAKDSDQAELQPFRTIVDLFDPLEKAGDLLLAFKSEILNFLRFAKLEAPTVVCEIGTADGGTNFLLSQALPTVQLMLGVDLYVKKRSKLQFFFREEQ